MVSVNDRVCEGFAQCDLNVALAFRNTAALPEQKHELIHEGRNRSHFAWQRALQFDARAVVILRHRHWEIILKVSTSTFPLPRPFPPWASTETCSKSFIYLLRKSQWGRNSSPEDPWQP